MKPSKLQPSPTPWWAPFTRHRSHRLTDLLLGALFLASVAFWVGSLSSVLAAGLVVAAVGSYIASLARRERDRTKRVAVSASSVSRSRDALDALDELLAKAPPIPLTDLVRVDAGEVFPLVEAAGAELAASGLPDQAHDLTRVILGDCQIPLTGQLRVNRRRAQRLLDALRSSGTPHLAADDEEPK
jgi:hypothetical protein